MRSVGLEWRLLDPRLFWRKILLLAVFFPPFMLLKVYKQDLALLYYNLFLLVLHLYILVVWLWRVRWRVLAENRRAFAVRLFALLVFVVILAILRFDRPFWELVAVVVLSIVIHVGILLSLTVTVRRTSARPVDADE